MTFHLFHVRRAVFKQAIEDLFEGRTNHVPSKVRRALEVINRGSKIGLTVKGKLYSTITLENGKYVEREK